MSTLDLVFVAGGIITLTCLLALIIAQAFFGKDK